MRLAISLPYNARALVGIVTSTAAARFHATDDEANNHFPYIVVRLPRRVYRGWVQTGGYANAEVTRWALRFSALNPGIRGSAPGDQVRQTL